MLRSSTAHNEVQISLFPTVKEDKQSKKRKRRRSVRNIPYVHEQLQLSFDEPISCGSAVLLSTSLKEDLAVLDGMLQEVVISEWDDKETIHLHCYLLDQSLHQALNPRSSAKVKREVLHWVNSPTPSRKDHLPFAFDLCCQYAGYNSEALREHLFSEMRTRGIFPY